jgi:hypothetical protein
VSGTPRRLIAVGLWIAAVPVALYGLLCVAFRNDEGGNATVKIGTTSYDAGSLGIGLLLLASALVVSGLWVLKGRLRRRS